MTDDSNDFPDSEVEVEEYEIEAESNETGEGNIESTDVRKKFLISKWSLKTNMW